MPEKQIPISRFSKVGEELLSLIVATPKIDYIKIDIVEPAEGSTVAV